MIPEALWGRLLVFAFVVVGSAQDVYLGSYFQGRHPIVMVTATFLIALVLFQLALRGRNLEVASRVWKFKKEFLFLNLTTMLNWLCFFFSLKYIEPAIAGAVAFSLGPAIATILNRWLRPQNRVHPRESIAAIGLAGGLAVLLLTTLLGESSMKIQSVGAAVVGLGFSFLAAIGMTTNSFVTKRLVESKFASLDIMAFRYFILLSVALLILPSTEVTLPWTDVAFWWRMFWLSLVLIMLPIFLIQKGIERTEPVAASIILALTPIVTFTFQFLDHDRLKPSALTLLGICICFVFSIFGATAPKADIGNTA